MKKDTPGLVKEIADFLSVPLTDKQVGEVVLATSLDNMRKQAEDRAPDADFKDFATKFFRKGAIGNWKEFFQGERLEEFNKWIEENLKDSDIKMTFN